MEDENESKFLNGIKYTSQVVIKEEVITADNNTSDSESTISDNDRHLEIKGHECEICSKYHSMFIILRNHECEEGVGAEQCLLCKEINHWTNCFKIHKESHELKTDHSSDSTTSDREDAEGKCKICLKYEFMVPLLSSHLCKEDDYKKCQDCSEVLQWESCYKSHIKSHETKVKIKEECLSESTTSDSEELEKLNISKSDCDHCQICLKYEFMFLILEENHNCDGKKGRQCGTCEEIQHWRVCFENHRKNHFSLDQLVKCKDFDKSECGICLKLNSIITSLMKTHCCINNKSCSVCTEVSYWLSCLNNHKKSNLSSEESVFENSGEKTSCSICTKFQSVLANLNSHECSKNKGKLKCGLCVEVAFWSRNFKQHESHHKQQILPLKNFLSCSDCGKRFSSEKMLNVHNSYCKSSYFSCDICGKKFLDVNSLKKHRIFQSCRSSTFVCKICNKSFSKFLDFKSHESFHKKMQLFQCSKCSTEFRSEYLLTKHKLSHR